MWRILLLPLIAGGVVYALHGLVLYYSVLSLFQRALVSLLFTVLLLAAMTAVIVGLIGWANEVFLFILLLTTPAMILIPLGNWYKEWRIVRKILQSGEALSKAKGCRLFTLGHHWWWGTQSYVGRIKEIENV
jgi:hypothetical protein